MQTTIDLLKQTHTRVVNMIAQRPAAALWTAIAHLALTLVIR